MDAPAGVDANVRIDAGDREAIQTVQSEQAFREADQAIQFLALGHRAFDRMASERSRMRRVSPHRAVFA
jgi:hypothetical protein